MLVRAAVIPPAEVREHVAAVVEASIAPGQGIAPVPADQLHLVIAQFGNLPNEEVPRLSSALAEGVPDLAPGPTLHLAGGDVAEERSQQMVLARLRGEVERLTEIARDVGLLAATRRLYVDRRRYRPAMHVAVVDPGAPDGAVDGLVSALESYQGPEWTMTGLALMRGSWAGTAKTGAPLYDQFEFFAFEG